MQMDAAQWLDLGELRGQAGATRAPEIGPEGLAGQAEIPGAHIGFDLGQQRRQRA